MAPLDRIRKALGPEKAAAFDRAFAAYADRVEQIVTANESAAPGLSTHFHAGNLKEARVERDEVFR